MRWAFIWASPPTRMALARERTGAFLASSHVGYRFTRDVKARSRLRSLVFCDRMVLIRVSRGSRGVPGVGTPYSSSIRWMMVCMRESFPSMAIMRMGRERCTRIGW
jgi:hypothetical protein